MNVQSNRTEHTTYICRLSYIIVLDVGGKSFKIKSYLTTQRDTLHPSIKSLFRHICCNLCNTDPSQHNTCNIYHAYHHINYSQRKYYWCTQNAKYFFGVQIVYFFQYCEEIILLFHFAPYLPTLRH